MDTREAYNQWAVQYDTNQNKTRDLEARSLRETLAGFSFENGLEIGCGTGKNTEWLVDLCAQLSSVDFSEEMLARAREKVTAANVRFAQADITQPWTFTDGTYDLVTFSLVLEHIEQLEPVFADVARVLCPGGHVYVGELHPAKQYAGSKARFDTEEGRRVVACYTHHLTDFIQAAARHGLQPVLINEYFDGDDRTQIPRILTLLFKKAV